MKQIELKGKIYNFPTTWHDITVRQLMQIEDLNDEAADMQKLSKIAAILLDVEKDEILGLEIDDFLTIINEVADVMTAKQTAKYQPNITLDGVAYKAKSIEEFSTREFTDFDTLSADGKKNLPMLLALIYHSEDEGTDYVKVTQEKAEKFLNLPASIAIEAVRFFSIELLRFVRSTVFSSPAAQKMMERNPKIAEQMKEVETLINGAGA